MTQNLVIDVSENENTSRVTMVSAFFHLEKSKHTIDEYKSWLKNFLGTVEAPVVFYTDNESAEMVREMRGNKTMTLNTMEVSFFVFMNNS